MEQYEKTALLECCLRLQKKLGNMLNKVPVCLQKFMNKDKLQQNKKVTKGYEHAPVEGWDCEAGQGSKEYPSNPPP